MKPSRRDFLQLTAATPALTAFAPLTRILPEAAAQPRRVFRHGVASGDPLGDRVVIWTRVSGAAPDTAPLVRWEIARTPASGRSSAGEKP